MPYKYLVIGISGITCGGKTSLAKCLNSEFPNSTVFYQDTYFLPEDSPKHTRIPQLNHINWEILSSLDMEKMENDISQRMENNRIALADLTFGEDYATNNVEQLIQRLNADGVKLLIVEGFSIFNYKPIEQLCHLKYYFTLDKETCWQRRNERVYEPPDVPGYFEQVVWPEYEKSRDEVFKNCKNLSILDGTLSTKHHYKQVISDMGGIFIHNNIGS